VICGTSVLWCEDKVISEAEHLEDEMSESCSTHERDEKCIQILDRKSWGNKLFGRHRHSWKYDIKTDLREKVLEYL